MFEQPLARLHPMSRKYYVPGGSTAMLDAVGETIDRLERDGTGIADTAEPRHEPAHGSDQLRRACFG